MGGLLNAEFCSRAFVGEAVSCLIASSSLASSAFAAISCMVVCVFSLCDLCIKFGLGHRGLGFGYFSPGFGLIRRVRVSVSGSARHGEKRIFQPEPEVIPPRDNEKHVLCNIERHDAVFTKGPRPLRNWLRALSSSANVLFVLGSLCVDSGIGFDIDLSKGQYRFEGLGESPPTRVAGEPFAFQVEGRGRRASCLSRPERLLNLEALMFGERKFNPSFVAQLEVQTSPQRFRE